MKATPLKTAIIILIGSFIPFLTGPGCGQKSSENKTVENTEAAKPIENPPTIPADSQAIAPVNPVDNNTNPETKEKDGEVKKTTAPTEKTKEPEPVKKPVIEKPAVPDKKPVPVVNKPPEPEPKPVTEPPKPPVVKEPEPVKPTPEPVPKKVEEPKPVVVEPPAPAQDEWVVPAKYKTMANPYPADKEALDLGKSLYGTHCRSCHGAKGAGDGPKASTIDTKIGSFLSAEFRAQKAGEVFYKTTYGRKDMPKFEKKIPDEEERWAVVSYIMSLK